MKKHVWLSFDLGLNGDYEGIYSWLDDHGAKECGDSVAVLQIDATSDVPGVLKRGITKAVRTDKKSRIYAVWLESGRVRGKFIFGTRKASPWEGCGRVRASEVSYDG